MTKSLILKLDDIGRDSNGVVFDVISWAFQNKLPVSIGPIGSALLTMPRDIADLVSVGVRSGFVELWNHGYNHIRYDLADESSILADLVDGHQAISETFGVSPIGFGFPFNKSSPEAVIAIRKRFPEYFIFEQDFEHFKMISPEYNVFADGQPNVEYFFKRLGDTKSAPRNLMIQAHPPRWTTNGFYEFTKCVKDLTQIYGYTVNTASDKSSYEKTGALYKSIESKLAHCSADWLGRSDQFSKTLSNFKSYFLQRFNSDAMKNYLQVSREMYPFMPRSILDIGSGLGNWSLPFAFSGKCDRVILNDINSTIYDALKCVDNTDSCEIIVNNNNLLNGDEPKFSGVDFLVSANTFNYLDPAQFFIYAQNSVLSGGRLLLMIQTQAFNNLRLRGALSRKDHKNVAEALSSDFCMLLRRHANIYVKDVRHVFTLNEIQSMAALFDFISPKCFTPVGEQIENGEYVYQCILFKRTTGMAKAIAGREDWRLECLESLRKSIGVSVYSQLISPEKIGNEGPEVHLNWRDDFSLGSDFTEKDLIFLNTIKANILAIRDGALGKVISLDELALIDSALAIKLDFIEFLEKYYDANKILGSEGLEL